MPTLLSHKRCIDGGEEQMLLAEDQPDLIESLDPRCDSSNNNRSCLRRISLRAKKREYQSVPESLDYLPSHSTIYKKWLQGQSYRLDWDRWLVMGIIGILVGILGFLTHQIIDYLIQWKWELVENYIQNALKQKAIIGYGLSQFKPKIFGINLLSFTRFWNTADK
ncbi:hypothetical protein JD844_016254 [Phrynosoma platyrhinos]|uniref:Uncharacterized protein n=1 Tax=Phrynosoma platyrhinos TaxID=52577 RepID=A0ABQ7SK43_PHRPL|nr:hypothetical protein JD844_016254 [Phrynosoma platyrhinos]